MNDIEPFGLGVSNCRSARAVITAVREAEQLGATVAFVAEDVNCRDAFTLCTLCATQTQRIHLGTGVVNPFTRNPTSIAMGVATLDEVSGGRAFLGIGTSSPSLIDRQMGIPSNRPTRVLGESVDIVRSLLSGERVNYQGQYFRYADAHLEVRPVQDRIPVFFAAMGPRTLQLAGRMADGVLLNVGATPDYVRWALEQIQVGLSASGRRREDFTVAAWLSAYVTGDYERGLQQARQWLATMLAIPVQGELLLAHTDADPAILTEIRAVVSGYPHAGDPAAAAHFIPPAVAAQMALVGTAREIQARIGEYRQAGVDIPVLGPPALRAVLAPQGA